MVGVQRIVEEAAFVLHSHPWRETSLIVEVFSHAHGRLPLVAKGARRPASPLRGLLMAFQPLELSWQGRGEVKTLTAAQWCGGQAPLSGAALMSAYYLNELLMRLLPRDDAHPQLHEAYAQTLRELSVSSDAASLAPVLRRFELLLLRELGYAPVLNALAGTGDAVVEDGRYLFIIERGLIPADDDSADAFTGRSLLAMSGSDFSEPETQAAARSLMRRVLQHYLGAHALESRRIFMELQEL